MLIVNVNIKIFRIWGDRYENPEKEKELTTYDRGKCRKLFFCNFIKGEMKIKSNKILKTSYLVSLSAILNLIL